MKNLLNVKGAQKLSAKEQQSIQGGDAYCAGGCAGKNVGDSCYTSSGGCRSVQPGICGSQLGGLVCIAL